MLRSVTFRTGSTVKAGGSKVFLYQKATFQIDTVDVFKINASIFEMEANSDYLYLEFRLSYVWTYLPTINDE